MSAPELIAIPAGTRGVPCRGENCDATLYFIRRGPPPGRLTPVDCDGVDCVKPTATGAGAGYSHFLSCPDADTFTKGKRKA